MRPSRKAFLSAATNLPRNTRLSTLTGRKKEWWEEIQRAWSGARPPAATHAVNMRMMLQSLIPGMEHAEEADLGSQVTGIAGDLQQSFGAGVEQ